MKLKICGMKRAEDIQLINEVKPDYAGFIFYKKSHRYKTPLEVKELIRDLSPDIKSVGVVVNETLENLLEIIRESNVDIIQLHGDEDQAYIDELKTHSDVTVWKAIRVRDKEDLNKMSLKGVDKFLLDAFNEQYGGSGKTFDHSLLEGINLDSVFIAGGINTSNIKSIKSLEPYGIDVSSSLETDKYKDKNKTIKFMEEYNNG